jgi:predicted GTPase
MNDKIKKLLENAEQSDAIAINKWRIENREQLREERKEKLKELMEKDKQQTAVEQFLNAIKDQILLSKEHLEMIESYADQCKEIEKERIETAYNKGTVHGIDYPESTLPITGEQYYNETFGG